MWLLASGTDGDYGSNSADKADGTNGSDSPPWL